jgi:hypothetical protein
MEGFQIQLAGMKTGAIKTLLKDIYTWKRDNKDKFSVDVQADLEVILNVERKETKIWTELSRRGYLTKKDYNDFFKMLSDVQKQKRVF